LYQAIAPASVLVPPPKTLTNVRFLRKMFAQRAMVHFFVGDFLGEFPHKKAFFEV
jgi:hypothetical protein